MHSTSTTTLNEQDQLAKFELRVGGLCKSFRSPTGAPVEVLRGVSFFVSAGEVVAITGASGAGKSTLLHLIGGLEAPDSGTIQLATIRNRDAESPNAAELTLVQAPCGIGFVFQFHHLLPDLNARENVALPLMIARLGRLESERRAALSLQEMGLGQHLGQRIADLSGGEQQRVAVARALVSSPGLVLADEPTGNLDASSGDEIGRLLLDYGRRRQAIVVIATHNERLAEFCDRVLVLRDGRLEVAPSLPSQ